MKTQNKSILSCSRKMGSLCSIAILLSCLVLFLAKESLSHPLCNDLSGWLFFFILPLRLKVCDNFLCLDVSFSDIWYCYGQLLRLVWRNRSLFVNSMEVHAVTPWKTWSCRNSFKQSMYLRVVLRFSNHCFAR